MIFKPQLIHLISVGRKTQTRRPVKPGEDRASVEGRPRLRRPARPPAGTRRSTSSSPTSAWRRLGAISFEDARAEGFKTRDEFWLYWASLYDKTSIADLDFDQPVWVITFRRDDRDLPRLLSARMGRGDYTARSAPGGPG